MASLLDVRCTLVANHRKAIQSLELEYMNHINQLLQNKTVLLMQLQDDFYNKLSFINKQIVSSSSSSSSKHAPSTPHSMNTLSMTRPITHAPNTPLVQHLNVTPVDYDEHALSSSHSQPEPYSNNESTSTNDQSLHNPLCAEYQADAALTPSTNIKVELPNPLPLEKQSTNYSIQHNPLFFATNAENSREQKQQNPSSLIMMSHSMPRNHRTPSSPPPAPPHQAEQDDADNEAEDDESDEHEEDEDLLDQDGNVPQHEEDEEEEDDDDDDDDGEDGDEEMNGPPLPPSIAKIKQEIIEEESTENSNSSQQSKDSSINGEIGSMSLPLFDLAKMPHIENHASYEIKNNDAAHSVRVGVGVNGNDHNLISSSILNQCQEIMQIPIDTPKVELHSIHSIPNIILSGGDHSPQSHRSFMNSNNGTFYSIPNMIIDCNDDRKWLKERYKHSNGSPSKSSSKSHSQKHWTSSSPIKEFQLGHPKFDSALRQLRLMRQENSMGNLPSLRGFMKHVHLGFPKANAVLKHYAEQEMNMTLEEFKEKFMVLRQAKVTRSNKSHSGSRKNSVTPSVNPYKCEYCHARFESSSTYQQHVENHLISKPYQCSICKKRFGEESVLKQHVQNTHIKTDKKTSTDNHV